MLLAPPLGELASVSETERARPPILSKHILQLFEETLALFVVLLFQGTLKLLQGIPLGLVQLLGDLHLALDVHIAPAAAVQILDALAAQTEPPGCR